MYPYQQYQQEIKFFWPLTEQMELDLDYTDCNTKNKNCTLNKNPDKISLIDIYWEINDSI